MTEPCAVLLDAEFAPGPSCRPFERHQFQMQLCPLADGLRARWVGRRWVADPAGRDVLMQVTLLEMCSGAFYLAAVRLELGAVPFIVRVDAVNPARPAFTIGPADIVGTGDEACLTVAPV